VIEYARGKVRCGSSVIRAVASMSHECLRAKWYRGTPLVYAGRARDELMGKVSGVIDILETPVWTSWRAVYREVRHSHTILHGWDVKRSPSSAKEICG
jgi:hypothetical protein